MWHQITHVLLMGSYLRYDEMQQVSRKSLCG